jgi:hypothetical protein
VTAATRALPVGATIPIPTRYARVLATPITLLPEALCRTCGPLPAGGLYDCNAENRGRSHVQQTGHIVTVTSGNTLTLRLDGLIP